MIKWEDKIEIEFVVKEVNGLVKEIIDVAQGEIDDKSLATWFCQTATIIRSSVGLLSIILNCDK